MKVYIGSDHAGYELKEKLKAYLHELASSKEFLEKIDFRTEPGGFTQLEVEDKGAFELNPTDDYPDFIRPVAQAVGNEKNSVGIVLGGSGEGEEMSANKFNNIRALEYYGGTLEIVKLAREHNDANVLSLGARFVTDEEAKEAVKLFLETPFSNDPRHVRRIEKI
jgi:ribose 5-phosphate isomerase B